MNQSKGEVMGFYVRKYANVVLLVIGLILMVPGGAILATWNTLPGEKLYPVKSYLEKVALALVGDNFALRSDLQVQFMERRFDESIKLLSRSSTEGLDDLVYQVRATKTEIVRARYGNNEKEAELAKQKAEELTQTLKEYQGELEVIKSETNNNVDKVEDFESKDNQLANKVSVQVVQDEINDVIGELDKVVQSEVQNKNGENRERKKDNIDRFNDDFNKNVGDAIGNMLPKNKK